MELTISNNGHEMNWIHEVDSILTHDEMHEIIIWSDASITIDSLMQEGIDREHVALDLAALWQLRDFLNSQRITGTLASA